MNLISKTLTVLAGLAMLLNISGCAPEIGSEKWCAQLEEKPTGDWTGNELANFAKHCVIK